MATYSLSGGVLTRTDGKVTPTNPNPSTPLYTRQPIYQTTFDQAGYDEFAKQRAKEFEIKTAQEKAKQQSILQEKIKQQQLAYAQRSKLSGALLQGSSQPTGDVRFRQAEQNKLSLASGKLEQNIVSADKGFQDFVSKEQKKAEQDIESGKQKFVKRELVGYQTVATTTDAKPSNFSSAQWSNIQAEQSKYATGISTATATALAEQQLGTTASIKKLAGTSLLGSNLPNPFTEFVESGQKVSIKKELSSPFTDFVESGQKVVFTEPITERIQRTGIDYYNTLTAQQEAKIQAGLQGVRTTSPINTKLFGDSLYTKQLSNLSLLGTTLNQPQKLVATTRAEQQILGEFEKTKTLGVLAASDLYVSNIFGNPIETKKLVPLKQEITSVQNEISGREKIVGKLGSEIESLNTSLAPKISAYESFLQEKDLDKSTEAIELSSDDYVVANAMRDILKPEQEKLAGLNKLYDLSYGQYSGLVGSQEKLVSNYNKKVAGLQDTKELESAFEKLTPEQQRTFYLGSTSFSPDQLAILPTQRAAIENPFGAFGAYGELTLTGRKAFDAKYYSKFDADVKANQFTKIDGELKYLGETPSSRKDLLAMQRDLEKYTIDTYIKSDRSLENLGTIGQYTIGGAAIGGAVGLFFAPSVPITAAIGGASGLVSGISDVLTTESLLYSTGDPLFAKAGGTTLGIATGLLLAPLEGVAIKGISSARYASKLKQGKIVIGDARLLKSGLNLDELIGTGGETGLTKGAGKSLSLYEVPITTYGRKGASKTVFQEFAVMVDDSFFSGTGEAILSGGKKGAPKIVNLVDDSIVRDAASTLYERGTNPLSTRLAREGIFISGERNVKIFKLGESVSSITTDTGLQSFTKARFLETPFLNELSQTGFFTKQPTNIFSKTGSRVKEFVQTKTGKLRTFNEDYFESFATENVLQQDIIKLGDMTGTASVVKKFDNADDLLGVGAYQSFSSPKQIVGSGKTFFPEGVQEVRFIGIFTDSAEQTGKQATKMGKKVGTDWIPTTIDTRGVPRTSSKISDIGFKDFEFQLKNYPNDMPMVSASDLARYDEFVGRSTTQNVAKTTKTAQAVSEANVKATQRIAKQFAADSKAMGDFGITTGGLTSGFVQSFNPQVGGAVTLTRTQTLTQPAIQEIEMPTFNYTIGDTYGLAKTRTGTQTLTQPLYDYPKAKATTSITYDMPDLLKESVMLKGITLTKTSTGLSTRLAEETALKSAMKSLGMTDTLTKSLTKEAVKEASATRLKESELLKTILKEDTMLKQLLKEQTATKTQTINPVVPPIPPPTIGGFPFGMPKMGSGSFPSGWGFNVPKRKTKTGRVKPLLRVKSDFFRKFVTGEKDLVVSAENVKLIKSIRAAKGSFLGFIPTKELLAKRRGKKKKAKKK